MEEKVFLHDVNIGLEKLCMCVQQACTNYSLVSIRHQSRCLGVAICKLAISRVAALVTHIQYFSK